MIGSNGEIILLLDSRGIGGIETHVLNLAAALRAKGEPARVVLLRDHGPHPMAHAFVARGVPLTVLGGGRELPRFLAAQRPKVLHTHGYRAGVLGRVWARLLGVPVVSTYHSGDRGVGRVRLYSALDRWTAFLAPSIAVSHEIAASLPAGTAVIENFVPVPDAAATGARGAVAFVGRLSPEKGPDTFCELAARLPNLRWHVYGDGPMRSELTGRFGDRVVFHGAVADMAAVWRETGLLCMPSRREGLPMAALEAMADGVPVAAFAVGGLADLLSGGACGWLAPPDDRDALAAAIATWSRLDLAARRAIGHRARAMIAERYSPDAVLPKILAVYRRAVERSGGDAFLMQRQPLNDRRG